MMFLLKILVKICFSGLKRFKENKVKASASNCYTRQRGSFIKLPESGFLPVFKADYSDKTIYTLVNDKVLDSKESLSAIFRSVLKHIITQVSKV